MTVMVIRQTTIILHESIQHSIVQIPSLIDQGLLENEKVR